MIEGVIRDISVRSAILDYMYISVLKNIIQNIIIKGYCSMLLYCKITIVFTFIMKCLFQCAIKNKFIKKL